MERDTENDEENERKGDPPSKEEEEKDGEGDNRERSRHCRASCTSRAISALRCRIRRCCIFPCMFITDAINSNTNNFISRVTTKHVFATLSFIAEIFIFLNVGMDALDIEKWRFISQSPGKSVGISSVLLGLILVKRAAFVFPLSFLSNLLQKSPHVKIDMKQQVTIWWSGLMRGWCTNL
ncbi:sodium/hydrogen exchanger 1-like [Arachis duranensis]|uniref:Sodium/hydrogen exchanger 1-like n=1 Tax=Arachis duranensis TaxID=130453 RepID=A0A6P4DHP4_ARADU|nr:sodium/hydrogen exchanger 1-like [Arachis duranensis]